MSLAGLLLIALVLDALLGEPDILWRRLTHPAVLMGRAVGWCETRFNHGTARKAKGVAAMAGLALSAGVLGVGLAALPLGPLIEIVIAAILLAHKSLVQHVTAVADGLRESQGKGRRMVARIVGRDTAGMDGPAISRAAIESAAENFSDGVVAPALWFLIGGLPGILIYKITNTADSMIGYRTPALRDFGWAAARLDDVLNWVPARLTALILFAAFRRWPNWSALRRDAALHRSPNAGWPEAAMAIGLDVALAGPRSYDGKVQEFPWVWPDGNRAPGPPDIDRATDALWRSWWVLAASVVLIMAVL